MQNGTHAEAIEAGFTSKQAALFSRACVDIKHECWQHFREKLLEREMEAVNKQRLKAAKIKSFLLPALIGIVVGVLIGTSIC